MTFKTQWSAFFFLVSKQLVFHFYKIAKYHGEKKTEERFAELAYREEIMWRQLAKVRSVIKRTGLSILRQIREERRTKSRG
jgi:hypothetical protein